MRGAVVFGSLFAVWTALVATGMTNGMDRGVRPILEAGASRPLWQVITHVGDTIVVAVLAAAMGVALWWRGRRRDATTLLVITLATALLVWALKAIFMRDRPDADHAGWSYPSGHAAGSLVFYMAATRAAGLDRRVLLVGACVGGLIAISRLALGVHWLSDVVGSVLLSVAILLAASPFWSHDLDGIAQDMPIEQRME